MPVNKNPEWVAREKIVEGLIVELKTFENKNLKLLSFLWFDRLKENAWKSNG